MRTRKFSELTKDWPAERKERVAKRVQEALATMHLDELRKAREMTQTKLAETLGVNQGEISKIEHRADLYISTLAEYVAALGGELEIRAVFPDHEVRITQFENFLNNARPAGSEEFTKAKKRVFTEYRNLNKNLAKR